jgi:signal transduction histidine kinase
LPISRQLIEMHGGSLTAQSAQGKGSTFTVVLPVSAEIRRSAEAGRETWHAS